MVSSILLGSVIESSLHPPSISDIGIFFFVKRSKVDIHGLRKRFLLNYKVIGVSTLRGDGDEL